MPGDSHGVDNSAVGAPEITTLKKTAWTHVPAQPRATTGVNYKDARHTTEHTKGETAESILVRTTPERVGTGHESNTLPNIHIPHNGKLIGKTHAHEATCEDVYPSPGPVGKDECESPSTPILALGAGFNIVWTTSLLSLLLEPTWATVDKNEIVSMLAKGTGPKIV